MTNRAYEATNSDVELIAEIKAAAEKATPGEWWSDVVECDGTYGNGDECAEGFHSYAVYDSNNQTLLDMTNSTAACIQVDCDDESHYAWDEVAERNAEYIVLARPENVLKLIAALEQAQQEKSHLEYRLKNVQDAFLAVDERALRAERRVSDLEKTLRGTEESLIAAVDQVAELEAAPSGMMQLSNELAEMKRKPCLTNAVSDVLSERQRQINAEGWTPEHDDEHSSGEMANAAGCYALCAGECEGIAREDLKIPLFWPWADAWWKPADTRRDLVKAGALIIAEIERIDRAAGGTVEGSE